MQAASEETKHWEFHHIGIIVADMEEAVRYYTSLGFIDVLPERSGPTGSSPWEEMTAYGKTVIRNGQAQVAERPKTKPVPNRWCQLGSIRLELLQPVEGGWKNVNREFLDTIGEGINHIAYTVDADHFDDEVAKMKARGIDIIMSGKRADGGGFAYFDTRKVGGFIIALMKAAE